MAKAEKSEAEEKREKIKVEIREIYDDSYQNYGAPKIAKILNSKGIEVSERTVGVYIKALEIKVQW